ncbi:hypothetical protein H310_12614 [Aphanomyces invadans]|uniref:PDZ domain-containing protein n=1 Tax=Aphanomyces invadans TaxID=157072 RepID=A0A024TH71_9STRA|nr:hypothetical protein H310_12614 [Aphanomyces invadans]ETV93349.1 hypothetical protein H310_12614 [Aphanomyces invadans]|eukprot:XP_008877985.1 hypothetical protein H310_12614 [Aphanomyces invadans]
MGQPTAAAVVTVAAAATAVATLLWPASSHKDSKAIDALETALHDLQQRHASTASIDNHDDWEKSLDWALAAIVSIQVMHVASFDGASPACSVATGFIVDRTRGLILTNRHVVTPGPVVADAVFVNHEEVPLVPIYRDPVHDFGFFRFDPAQVRFQTDLPEIPLRPDLAKVGTPIRVVGNDNAEKVQILPGILAKLDRAAPQYGLTGYNDFNTFYYAAASSTSGGSSGSPVLNAQGMAIALNAGGATNAASSYYLPLDRVTRALKLLQQGEVVTRGTWQTIFRHVPFDEARQLGLPPDIETIVRELFPLGLGVLVVDQVLPEGPADGLLHVGDILVSVSGAHVTTFICVESVLDSHVGQSLNVEVVRGGRLLHVAIRVQDLHGISPCKYFQMGSTVLHDLSYQQARNLSWPVRGVYVSNPGHLFVQADIPRGALIVSVQGVPMSNLDDFIRVFSPLATGTRVCVHFIVPSPRHVTYCGIVTVDHRWFPGQLRVRNDDDGLWQSVATQTPPQSVVVPVVNHANGHGSETSVLPPIHASSAVPTATTTLLAAMVIVRVDLLVMVDGIVWSGFEGIGYIVNATKGYVLVDRATVHSGLGNVVITIAAALDVPATIRYIDPMANFAILQYDPNLVDPHSVTTLPLNVATDRSTSDDGPSVAVGDTLQFVGLTRSWHVVAQPSTVTKIDRLVLPASSTPYFRPGNVRVWSFDQIATISGPLGGVLTDPSTGHVKALWLQFCHGFEDDHSPIIRHYGAPIPLLENAIGWCDRDAIPAMVKVVPIEFGTTKLSTARDGLGLSSEWIHRLETKHRRDNTRYILTVTRCLAGSQASTELCSGDLILSVNGDVVANESDLSVWCDDDVASVEVVVLRNKVAVTLPAVEAERLGTMGTTHVIVWCGLVIQPPPLAVLQMGFVHTGVYIAQVYAGTPADKCAVYTQRFLVEVNDIPTPTMEAFVAAVRGLGHHASARLKTISLNTRVRMFTLKTEYHYNPTVEYKYEDDLRRWSITKW